MLIKSAKNVLIKKKQPPTKKKKPVSKNETTSQNQPFMQKKLEQGFI